MPQRSSTDAIVIGAGLSGLVAASELLDRGRRVTILEQEPAASLGGQAWWSFGGLFLVDSPEQRRMGIHDGRELAGADWAATAGFDRDEDAWPRAWAEAYLDFAAGEQRSWLHGLGVRFFPVVGWAERGVGRADGPGNSVPRFHIVWGTGPGLLRPFEARVRRGIAEGRARILHRHRVTELLVRGGAVVGAAGEVLAPDAALRGRPSTREALDDFEVHAPVTAVTSGGIGGNPDLVRAAWPDRLGAPPEDMLVGVPAHVDGLMLGIAERAGARRISADRMWHYTEGIRNWNPVWPGHGIRILPGPSSLWLDARGHRLPAPLFPGFDTLGTLRHLTAGGNPHSWFVLTQRIVEKEFALSGSEQNPDLTGRDLRLLASRVAPGAPGPVDAFLRHGTDFVTAPTLPGLLRGMREIGDPALDLAEVERTIRDHDRQVAGGGGKDAQLAAIRSARAYRGDRLIRVARPHRLLDPAAGPLIAVQLHVLTRKSLGGLATDLDAAVLSSRGTPVPGLFAAGEAAGFGGGGMHGYRSLEGTFLGGCLFSGRTAGRAMSR